MEVGRHTLAGHAVPQGTFSRLTAIHLVLQGSSPCEYIPVRSTDASVRPTVQQAYAGQLPGSLIVAVS